MEENDITFLTRGAIYSVYNSLGPGLLESSYEVAMEYELINRGLFVERQVGLPLIYNNLKMEVGYRLDLLIERKVIVEIKSVETLSKLHFKQLVTYLKLSDLRVGILVNFNTAEISNSIHRKVNNFVP
jgi:GxxExxY protein